MKKTLLFGLCLGATLSGEAQVAQFGAKRMAQQPVAHRPTAPATGADRSIVWSDDFSTPSNWVIETAVGAPANMVWEIGVGLQNTGSYPTDPIVSTTAANGYAMFDSDGYNNTGTVEENSYFTNATPIDLSGSNNVILQFENQYRRFDPNSCYVVISTNNTDWPTLDASTDVSGMPNVFEVFADVPVNGSSANPETIALNISSIAGGSSTVWVRFQWTGLYGYTWFVDDVQIIDQPDYDLVVNYGFVSHTGTGEEYGRIPTAQLPSDMNVGAEILNFGAQPQTNVVVNMEVRDESNNLAFSASADLGTIAPGATAMMDQMAPLPALAQGIYAATFVVTSTDSPNDATPANDTTVRRFSVNDDIYSLDGIGVHADADLDLTALGTASFTDNADGLIVMTYYQLAQTTDVYGIQVEMASGSSAGAVVYVALYDTTSISAGDVSQPIDQSDPYEVTAADITNGYVNVLFSGAVNLTADGYYAAVTLLSDNNTYDISVLDDITVPQPNAGSLIYTVNDQTVYTNGNASAVRMLLDPTVSVGEDLTLPGVSMFPNPSNGLVYITTASMENYTVEVMNLLGERVLSNRFYGKTTMDLSGFASGVYMVRVESAKGSTIQRITLN